MAPKTGSVSWPVCARCLPDRPVEDLKDDDEIYHVLYDINEKFQIPSELYVNTGRTYEKDGYVPKWRAIRSDATGASWSLFAPTCISATPGSGPTVRSTPRSFPDLLFASCSTTLPTR